MSEMLTRGSEAAPPRIPAEAGAGACRLSVAIVTHNHERYVAEAIDSVLAQQTSFPFEIVVGDDASKDRTLEILEEYASRHDNVRLLRRDRKLGMARNYVDTLSACRGTYVAMLDGDDYWSRADKLEAQVAFLERHPDFAVCFHDALKVFEGTAKPPVPFCAPDQNASADLSDLLVANFMPTSSVVYRRDPDAALPGWLLELRFVDWPLHILNARRGRIGYLAQRMSVYRIHPGGDWNSMDVEEKVRGIIQIYESVGAVLGTRYRGQLHELLAMRYSQLARHEYRRRDLASARPHLRRALRLGGMDLRRDRLALLADLYAPFLRRWYGGLRALGGGRRNEDVSEEKEEQTEKGSP